MTITHQQAEQYKKEGFLSPISVIDYTEAERYRQRFDQLETKVDKKTAQIGLIDYHFQEKFIWELATHPRILDAVEAIAGPNFYLLATHFFNKYGEGDQAEAFVAWHQDVTFWGLEPPYAITAWYAVDDSERENGCMRVIPGTHVTGVIEHGKSDIDGNLLSINQEVAVTPDDEEHAVDLILKAGEMSLHNGTLIHGSLPNKSDRRRCGLTLRYVPTWVKQTELNSQGKGWNAVLVRGEDKEKNFAEIAAPF
ncbi:phytanoyl-CoA dioxygenase family protein [Chloroflexi bacterium TSY]|nr:phytanoyl-CoA dioxygenase family protein [Chloroflexi bacterium TSY]